MSRDVGRYQIEDEALNRDAFGILYAGTDRESGQPVLLKQLHADGQGASEAGPRETYRGLVHEDLVLPLDELAAGADRFVVLPRPDGELLADCLPRLRRGGLSGRHKLLRIVAGAARGLDQIHRSGLVHGQVSPAAIVAQCAAPARSSVLCFGLSHPRAGFRYLRDNPNLRYVSGEQLRGGIDRSTDIYAIGMLLYAAFARTPPYPDDSPYDLAEQILWGECAPFEPELDDVPAAIRPAIVPDLEAVGSVAAKALQRDPRARYATMGELSRTLGSLSARLSPIELGTNLHRTGRHELAALVLEDAAEGPDAARALVLLGKTCSEGLRDYERGLVAYRRALRENPELVIAREGLVAHYARFGHLALAKREMLELLKTASDDIGLNMRYGDILRQDGDADAALNVYRHVADLNPYHLPAHARAIAVEMDRGDLESAEARCLRALDTIQTVVGKGNLGARDVADIYCLRAGILRRKALPDRAIAWAEKAVATFPGHEDSHALLAELYLESGDGERAVEHLLSALSLASDAKKTLERLARLMDRAGSPS